MYPESLTPEQTIYKVFSWKHEPPAVPELLLQLSDEPVIEGCTEVIFDGSTGEENQAGNDFWT